MINYIKTFVVTLFVMLFASTSIQAEDIIPICAVADTKFDSTSISNNIPTRNNNPGNIKKTGHKYIGEIDESDTYETFVDVNWGFAAMFSLLHRKYSGMTIEEAIGIYAPNFENDTNAYVKFIEDRTGFPADAVEINSYDIATIIPIVEAMATYEGGKNWILVDIHFGWQRWISCK